MHVDTSKVHVIKGAVEMQTLMYMSHLISQNSTPVRFTFAEPGNYLT
jgi:hypothetical protein